MSCSFVDLQVLEGVYKDAGSFKKMIPSHEPVGVIVKMSSKAESDGKVKVGDRVLSINVSHLIRKEISVGAYWRLISLYSNLRHTATVVNAMHASKMESSYVKSFLAYLA